MCVKMHRVMCLLVTALLILLQISCQNNVEKQFSCKNEECSEPMGKFRVAKKYNPDSPGKIGANARDMGVILAVPEDRSTGLLKVKINNEIGFFPLHFVTILKEEKSNITVKLAIPVNSGSNDVPSAADPYKEKEKSIGLNDASASDVQSDEINSTDSSSNTESSYNESSPSVLVDSSNKNEKPIQTLKSALDEHSTQDHVASEPPSNDQTKEDTGSSNKESSFVQKNVVEEVQAETISHEKGEQVLPDIPSKLEHTSAEANESIADVVSVKLENTTAEVDESKTVNVIEESENVTERSISISRDTIENSTQAIREEKANINISVKSVTETSSKIQSDAHVNEISNSSDSISSTIESVNDPVATDINLKNIQNESLSIEKDTVASSLPKAENLVQSSGTVIEDHVTYSSDNVEADAKTNPELSLSSVNVDSQNSSETADVSSNTEADVQQKTDRIPSESIADVVSVKLENTTAEADESKTVNVIEEPENVTERSTSISRDTIESSTQAIRGEKANINISVKSVTKTSSKIQSDAHVNEISNSSDSISSTIESVNDPVATDIETSAESKLQLPLTPPTMRSFPDNEESLVLKESEKSVDEVVNVTQLDNQDLTSEQADPVVNATLDHESNTTENNHVTEANMQHDSATPAAALYEIPLPLHIETTTETNENKLPIESLKNIESNESISTESSATEYSSPVSEDTSPSKVPEPSQYIKTQPYPSLFPNIATENQPAVTEKIDQVSSQEIIEENLESLEQMSESASSESVTVPVGIGQKQGLNDFIHSSRKEIHEITPAESIDVPETLKEKSVYETMQEYFPDFSVLFYSFYEKSKSFFDSQSSSQTESIEAESCSADEFCGTDRLNSHMDKPEHSESETIYEIPLLGVVNKDQITLVSGILTTVFLATILLWWLMNYFTRCKKVNLLVSRINQLENKLLISTREVVSLQEQLVEQDSVAESKQNAADVKRIAEVYEHKINQYKKRTVELEDKVLYLEKELENVSNSALEMHKLLENSLATQAHSKLALDEVETLRTLAESQEIQIDELKREINSVITENECLKVDNDVNKSAIKKLEKECNAQTKKNVELSEKNRNLTLKLDKELENNSVLESNYKSEIYELRSKLEDVEMSLKRSDFQVQELQRAVLEKQDGVQISNNDVQLKIQISTLEAMNNELSGQLNEQKNARRMLEDHVGDITKDLNNLKKSFENSEKERNQAVTKLQVLTQFFKEKEEQLKKELEAKDKLSLERESKDQSLSQKLTLMREEISNLKIQNEELKKEVLDQEASYKVQLANAEQKTREHWFALRQAERKYKESQQEAAILRNKILVLETNMSSLSHKVDDKNSSGLNGDIPGVSPVLYHPSLSPDLLPYPSPSDFIPPPPSPIASHSPDFFPPEPIYSPDERLPPLGGRRAPSPPPPISPDDDFGPPPPVMKFASGRNHNVEPPVPGGYNRRTPPPSGRHRSQYKSRPPRSSIDSPSSGMSLESLDKSGR